MKVSSLVIVDLVIVDVFNTNENNSALQSYKVKKYFTFVWRTAQLLQL